MVSGGLRGLGPGGDRERRGGVRLVERGVPHTGRSQGPYRVGHQRHPHVRGDQGEQVSEGATVLAQAGAPTQDAGCYIAPTVLEGEASLTIASQEVFGPVTTVLRVSDLDAAIELANATPFGLTASVFTRDEAAVRRCLDEVDAGLIKVNGPSTGSEVHAPFGGLCDSSFPAPREQGSDAVADFFSITKTAYLRALPREVTS